MIMFLTIFDSLYVVDFMFISYVFFFFLLFSQLGWICIFYKKNLSLY